jgi:chromosome segregation ATPase
MTDEKRELVKGIIIVIACAGLVFVVTYSGHTSELIDPSMTGSSQNETGSSPNSVTPLDDLKDSWAKLKEELKGLSEDSETLSLLLDKALTEASALQSSLTQSMTQSETLKRLSDGLGNEAQGSGSGASSASTGP